MQILNLCAGYGNRTVINNFSLTIAPGDRLIIAGPNGCGKTTLLKCILGIIKPKSGKILLEAGETMAYCKQDFPNASFPITAEEVVAMGLNSKSKNKKEQIEKALEKAGATSLKERLFYSLSGGERQKISLARCYCQEASILILDEPSSFLDSASRGAFINQMKKLERENFAIVAVTHDEEIINQLGWKTVRGEEWSI